MLMLTPDPADGGAQMTNILSPTTNSDQSALNLRTLMREAGVSGGRGAVRSRGPRTTESHESIAARLDDPPRRLEQDISRDREEQQRVEDRNEDLEAIGAEASLARRRARCEPDRDQSERGADDVGKNVTCVGEERQTVRREADDSLGDEDGARDAEHDEHSPAVRAGGAVLMRDLDLAKRTGSDRCVSTLGQRGLQPIARKGPGKDMRPAAG